MVVYGLEEYSRCSLQSACITRLYVVVLSLCQMSGSLEEAYIKLDSFKVRVYGMKKHPIPIASLNRFFISIFFRLPRRLPV